MSADGGAKKIFISHAIADPDWPDAAVEALAVKIQKAGATVWLDLWHEREKGHKLPDWYWIDWMEKCLQDADRILCLCSEKYAQLARRDSGVPSSGYGIAYEMFEMVMRFYGDKQHNENFWCWTLRLGQSDRENVLPSKLRGRCPEYVTPGDDHRLVKDLVGQQARPHTSHEPVSESGVPEAVVLTPSGDALTEQCRLVCERLELAGNFWLALCRDDLQRQQPAALAGHDSFVRWLTLASADDAEEVMFAARRALAAVTRKTDGTADACRLAELAAVSVYCLAVCRLVDVAALGKSYRFPKQASDAASLYCAVLATVLCGGRLELAPSDAGRPPRPSHAYDIRVPGAGDRGSQVFEQALFQALCADSPNAPEAVVVDAPLSDGQRAQVKARIRTIRRKERHALTLVLHDASHQASADAFSQDQGVPVFVCDPDVAAALIGMTAEELAAEIKEMWRELRYCNHQPADEKNPDTAHTQKSA